MATRLLPALLPALTLAWIAFGASHTVAQTITGTVVDAERGAPLAGASVHLLTTASAALDSAATNSAGRFTLAVPPRPGAGAGGAAGELILHVALDGYLSYTDVVVPAGGGAIGPDAVIERRVEMPLISMAAARIMRDAIQAEETFRLPLDELCGEPLRPWEAGVLVGVARDRRGMVPVPGAIIRLEPVGPGDHAPSADTAAADTAAADPSRSELARPRTRVATESGAYWFCNVPAGQARVIARADGFRADTAIADVRAGTVGWFDSILRRR